MTTTRLARVIKVGGRVQRDARLTEVLAQLWTHAPGSFCVVHGGGETISTLQTQLGGAPKFVAGRRVTTEGDIEVLRMALSGVSNKQLVSSLSAKGIPAVGISGEDGSLIVARTFDAATLGRVGAPADVDPNLVCTLLAGGFLPVISPVSRDGDATNGVAASSLNVDEVAHAIESGIATEGMATKLRAALDALARGVPAVRIGGLDALLDSTLGTTLLAAPQLA